MSEPDERPLLEIDGLTVEFRTDTGVVHAVNDLSLAVRRGEILGIVGESGSGKSVTATSVLGLVREPPGRTVAGSIRFRGQDLRSLRPRELREIRGGPVGMIFQDPMTTLNPVLTIGTQIAEAIRLHHPGTPKRAALARARELLALVGVPDPAARIRQYPHEFSGGMRQRAMIAMAIANDPALIIADEPTTALDVTIQAQVLGLLKTAQAETGAATILITHDLGVVAELADRVAVMYAGRIVETATVFELFAQPRHPYTLGLLASLPRLDLPADELRPIPGSPPDMTDPPRGCAFHPRCPLARDRCRTERPALAVLDGGRQSACHFADELSEADVFPATQEEAT
ncbi:ABC transporter ATP-binding protein [Amycolatopsis sp. CA-230715]|uniref:ABC transporter ATP-binding protein n=1 Tax=Amycolatopsis sp. CA-230715 TaxID=2745196 RepID=UPI001C01319B|nr:ABC transporter ATP-binding protein [Amycolatopsis sp. CA-230715]QWF84942.1 Dipeptide transport ATP-binding protein DppD [Amycolatopsis sp. CA-230715]